MESKKSNLNHECMYKKEQKNERSKKEERNRHVKHLSVQACCHCYDASCFIVDGEHVGSRTLRVLRHDLVTQHPICCFGVIFVNRCYCHNKCSYGIERQKQNVNTFMTSIFFYWTSKDKLSELCYINTTTLIGLWKRHPSVLSSDLKIPPITSIKQKQSLQNGNSKNAMNAVWSAMIL